MIVAVSGYIGSGKDTVARMIQYADLVQKYPTTVGKWSYLAWLNGIEKQIHTWTGEWEIKKFAGKLKQMVSLLTGISVEDLEKQEVKEMELGPEWWQPAYQQSYPVPYKPTVRELLQKLGTDAVRDHVHPNAWVNALMADYKPKYTTVKGKEIASGNYEYYKLGLDPRAEEVLEVFPNWIISDVRFPNEAQAIKDRGGLVWRVNRIGPDKEPAPERHSSETSLDRWNFDHIIDNYGTLEDLYRQVLIALKHFKLIKS